jgi:hypothetical protein
MPIPINALSEPFPDVAIKRRKGTFGKILDYAETPTVIQRLNDVLEGEWSFTIVGYRIEAEEVIVHGELKISGEVHQQFGGSQITRKTDSGEIISLADDLKAAASDVLKKCASSFGVGLYLYADSSAGKSNGNQRKSEPNKQNGNGNGHLSQEMIAKLISQAKEAGFSQADLIKSAKQMFNSTLGQLNVVQAQELVKELNKSKETTHVEQKSTASS